MYKRSLVLASVFIPFFAVYISVSAWDWLMSLDVHWYSTMFGCFRNFKTNAVQSAFRMSQTKLRFFAGKRKSKSLSQLFGQVLKHFFKFISEKRI